MKITQFIILLFFIPISIISYGQESNKNINIGSKILYQDGTSKNCFDNGIYSFEKVQSIDNLKKEDIYDKIKSWIVSNYKISNDNIIYDEKNKEAITFNLTFSLTQMKKWLTIQDVNFKVIISIKDSKIRIQAKDFEFYGLDADKKVYQRPFNDIRPVLRSLQKDLYGEFDQLFDKMINGITVEAFQTRKNDW